MNSLCTPYGRPEGRRFLRGAVLLGTFLLGYALVCPLTSAVAASKTTAAPSSTAAAPSSSSSPAFSEESSQPVQCPNIDALPPHPAGLTLGQLQALVEQKNPAALYCLGDMYDRGQGVTEDPLLAAQWIRSAADLGYVDGMIRYGEMLARGRGVLPDMKRAALWFRKAAEHDHTEAQAYLGELYEEGRVVEKNMQEAGAWYARAALKKHPVALTRLGLMFSEGRGVKKDVGRGTLLLYEAALQGQDEAFTALRTLAAQTPRREGGQLLGLNLEKMTREELRTALQRSDISQVREDENFVCDIYNIGQAMPGATLMAACYAQDPVGALALVKIDYPTANKQQAVRIRTALEDRLGAPTAREGDYSLLWNFGAVMVVGQYVPTAMETSLIYIVPASYTGLPQTGLSQAGLPQAGASAVGK